MAEPKTRPTDANVDDFLDAVANERRRSDARAVDAMMRAGDRRARIGRYSAIRSLK